jgi:hypothetical protein
MSKDKDDQVLDDYLQGGSKLSQHYRAGAVEKPPKYVDDSILAAAHRAVESKPDDIDQTFASKWYVPVSKVAVVVLCVSLVFSIYQYTDKKIITESASVNEIDISLMDAKRDGISTTDEIVIDDDHKIDQRLNDTAKIKTHEYQSPGRSLLEAEVTRAAESDTVPKQAVEDSPAKRRGSSHVSDPKDIEMILQQEKAEVKKQKQVYPDSMVGTKPSAEERDEQSSDRERAIITTDEEHIAVEDDVVMRREIITEDLGKKSNADYSNLPPEKWLEKINELWQKGFKTEAEQNLNSFMKEHPDYPKNILLDVLHKDIILLNIIK